MHFLKKFWPAPFNIAEKDVKSFIINLLIFVVVCAVLGWLIGLLAGIPIIGIIFSLVGAVFEIYGLVGIILCILKFLGVVK